MATDYGDGYRPQSSATSLTIREHAAIQIMAAISTVVYDDSPLAPWQIAPQAVSLADALMNALYPPKPPNGGK